MSVKTFKLIVSPTVNCLDLCKYLDKNIIDINRLGVRVAIEKINKDEFDDVTVEALRKRGVTRLPALITPRDGDSDGRVYIGRGAIVDLFERNLNQSRTDKRFGLDDTDRPAELGTNSDLSEFYMRELYSGIDETTGRRIARKDKDEDDNENADIERRLAEYRRNPPSHRRTESTRADPIVARNEATPDDNIGTARMPQLEPSDNAGEDDMDKRMLAAWLENN